MFLKCIKCAQIFDSYVGLSKVTEVMLMKKSSGPSGMLSCMIDTCTTFEVIPFSKTMKPEAG